MAWQFLGQFPKPIDKVERKIMLRPRLGGQAQYKVPFDANSGFAKPHDRTNGLFGSDFLVDVL